MKIYVYLVCFLLIILPTSSSAFADTSLASSDTGNACPQNIDFIKVLTDMEKLMENYEGGQWVEYATVEGEMIGVRNSIRLSLLRNNDAKYSGIEVWFDKIGESATRAIKSSDGNVLIEMKLGKRIYSIPENADELDKRKDCKKNDISESIFQKIREASETAGQVTERIKVNLGEFDCYKVIYKSQQGDIVFYISKDVPLLGIVQVDFGKNRKIELVSYGKNAYTSFSVGVNPIPLSTFSDVLNNLTKNLVSTQKEDSKDKKTGN